MKDCKISVIIPVYNTELYVGACLDSVISQDFDEVEIICVNDGSQDDSLKVLLDYEKCCEKICIISYEENQGVAHARNMGLNAARGKYVFFLDSDDWIVEGALRELYILANEKNTDCILFNSSLVMETPGIGSPALEFNLPQYENQVLTGEEIFQIMIEHERYTSSVCRQFWSRKYLLERKCFFAEGALGEDALFSFKAYLSAERVMISNRKYHVYRRHGGTFSTLVSASKCLWMFRSFIEMLRMWMDGDYSQETSSAMAKRIDRFHKQVRSLYFRNKGQVEELLESELEKFLFNILVIQNKLTSVSVCPEKLEQIRNYSKVIIYGAAEYAMNVTEALQNNGIEIFCYVVTELHSNTKGIARIPVYSIRELNINPDECVIILGVVKKNRDDVVETLREYGFMNYLALD